MTKTRGSVNFELGLVLNGQASEELVELTELVRAFSQKLPASLCSKLSERAIEIVESSPDRPWGGLFDFDRGSTAAGDDGIRVKLSNRAYEFLAALRALDRDLDLVFQRHANLLGGASSGPLPGASCSDAQPGGDR